jgi:phosphoribosylformimino-5-aminoimidazole carboxamide ribotide isomerase
MLLIFPSIEVTQGRCVQLVHGEPGSEREYSIDPVNMAILWRGENAKTLHVIDLDGVQDGVLRNRETIRKMVEAVDIPIQVGGGLRNYEDIAWLFSIGVYRVVLGTAAVENPPLIQALLKEFGARKVAISLESWDGTLRIEGGRKQLDLSPLEHALNMIRLGVCRIVYSSVDTATRAKRLALDELRSMAQATGIRITSQGGVQTYQDLLRLQELEKYGVDSAIIGQPLYQNKFPCQRLWRLNERDLADLGPTRRL